jgi:hypothetical protein
LSGVIGTDVIGCLKHVNAVVRDAAHFTRRNFSGAYVKPFVQLHAVGRYDFSAYTPSNFDGYGRFACCGWAAED